MKNIGDFLSKFKIIRNPAENRAVVTGVIKEVTGIQIPNDKVKIQKGSIFLAIHPAQKGIVYMKKEEILSKIKVSLPDLGITSIV